MAASDSNIANEMSSIAHQPSLTSPGESSNRWSRREIKILLQAMREVESGGKLATEIASRDGISTVQNKWDSISLLCGERGIHKGASECQKQYFNMHHGYNKVKKWEMSCKRMGDSYWNLGSCSRREQKLPRSFDLEFFKFFEQKNFSAVLARHEEEFWRKWSFDSESEEEENADKGKGKQKVNSDGIPEPDPISGNKRKRGQMYQVKRRANNSMDDDVSNQLLQAVERNNSMLNQLMEDMKMVKEQQKEQYESLTKAIANISSDIKKLMDEK